MNRKTFYRGFTALSLAVGFVAVEGQQAFAAVDEIIVSARQRDEALTDVPATVSVFTEEMLERSGVERAEDFINMTAGVTLVDAAEVGDTQVNIRGINGSRDAENSFAFIVDGVLMTNPAAFNREFTNLQQIEVVKGPQGAIYGRNAAAGAIIVNTRKPGNEMEGSLKVSAGNKESYFVSASLGGPIVEDKAYFQVSGDWRTTDGDHTNIFLNKDDVVDDFENYNINGRLILEPNENMTIDSKVRYGEVEAAAISFNSAFALPAFAMADGFNDVNDHDFLFAPNIDPINEQEALEASVKLEYEMDAGTLTAWLLYSDIENDFLTDGTSGAFGFFTAEPNCVASSAAIIDPKFYPLPSFNTGNPVPTTLNGAGSFYGAYTPNTCDGYQYQVRNQEDVSFEIRFSSPSDQALRWSVGAYYLDLEREVGVATGIDDTYLGGTIARSLTDSDVEQLVHDQFDSEVFAVFGQLNYDINDDVEVSLALRWDREERKVKNLVDPTATTDYIDFNVLSEDGNSPDVPWDDGGSPLNAGLLSNPGGIPDQEKAFEQLQPKLSLTWDVNESLTVYGNWGMGFKSGGFNNQGSAEIVELFINQFIGLGVQDPVRFTDIFEKETSSAYELGFKASLFDGDLDLTGAIYHTEIDDMQAFEFFVGPFGLLRVVNNIDEVEIQGIELAANARLAEGLSAYGSVNFLDSEIKENSVRPDTVGNKSPYTADYTFNAGVEYEMPIPNTDLNFVARADYSHVGPTWFHAVQAQERVVQIGLPANYVKTEREDYGTLDLRLGVEGERWSVTAFAKNITDEEYLEEVIPAPEFGGAFIHPAEQRRWGIEAKIRF